MLDYGKGNHRRDCAQHQGGMPQIYSAHETETTGDVGQISPRIYAVLDNRKFDHQASIIMMEGKLCDQVFPISIDPRSNYSYVSPNLVDKRGLNK